MYKLTASFTNKAGRQTFRDFEGDNKAKAIAQADRQFGSGKWEFYNGKQIVTKCAQSSDVATIIKTKVL
jgi:hypothetical protein